jgi:flagellar hook assembly protein FlgD
MAALAVLGLAIFVLPFAYTTPPPLITQFRATSLFSPNNDGQRDQAVISVRLHEPGRVTLEVHNEEGELVALLVDKQERPKGSRGTRWDGADANGRPVPDGTYALNVRAQAGRKTLNRSRRMVIDTQPPRPAEMAVASSALAGPGAGQCRLSLTAADSGSVEVSAAASSSSEAIVSLGPRPIKADGSIKWTWNGRDKSGKPVAPGLYLIRGVLRDSAGNSIERFRSCWVGHITGEAVPAGAAPGERVGVVLTGPGGAVLPDSTPVRLALYRRAATPGEDPGSPLGQRVGGQAQGASGRVTVRLPRRIRADALWLVATTRTGRALIALGRP